MLGYNARELRGYVEYARRWRKEKCWDYNVGMLHSEFRLTLQLR